MSNDDETRSWINRTAPARPVAAPAAAPSAPALVEGEDDPHYRAWGQGHPETDFIDFRLKPDDAGGRSCRLFPLRFVGSVAYEATPHGDHMTFAFPSSLVTVSGDRLDGLRVAVIGGKVGFIAEHDPARWPAPAASQPVVRKIEFFPVT